MRRGGRWLDALRRGLRLYLLWLTHRPSTLVLMAVPLTIGWGWLGAPLGLPLLFRGEAVWQQLEAGVAVGLLLAHLVHVGRLVLRGVESAPSQRADGDAALALLGVGFGVGTWVATPTLATAVLVITASATMIAAAALGRSDWLARRQQRALERFDRVLAGRARTAATIAALRRVAARVLAVAPRDQHSPGLQHDDRVMVLRGVALLLAWCALLVIYLLTSTRALTAAVFLCVAIAIIASAWGWLRYWSRRSNAVLLAAAGTAAAMQALLFSRCHSLRSFDEVEPVPLSRCDDPTPALLDERATLTAWRAAQGQQRPLLVVVATSGGGIRAAGWTVHVLQTLAAELPGFAARTRLITGASGGMVGATAWVAERQSPSAGDDATLLRQVTEDSLGPVAAHLALLVLGSRGIALERAWEQHAPAFARPWSSLAAGEAAGTLPSLVFAPVVIEDGRRLLVSHLDLRGLTDAWSDAQRDDLGTPSRAACQWGALFPEVDPRLSELARISASFAYISPAVRLPTIPIVRAADAGYYDPFGVELAARWLEHHADWIVANTRGAVLIQIRDGDDDVRALPQDEPGVFTRALSPWLAPLTAVLRLRSAAALFRNDAALASLQPRLGEGVFTSATFVLPEHVSLSWRLTATERRAIDCGFAAAGAERIAEAPPCDQGTDGADAERITDARTRNAHELARLRARW
ncbi:MAG: hypothetical protein K1X88_29180 [Nannocystaceae bacterium]|nr:hypothetical protein [Nannocystaceae bacterium]